MTTSKIQKKEIRRSVILSAATSSFLQRGYANTSMSGLIQVIGGSKGTIWSYFHSKEELFSGVIHTLSSKLKQQWLTERGARNAIDWNLKTACAEIISHLNNPMLVGMIRLLISEHNQFPELRKSTYDEIVDLIDAELIPLFNVLKPTENPFIYSRALRAVILENFFNSLIESARDCTKELDKYINELLDTLFEQSSFN